MSVDTVYRQVKSLFIWQSDKDRGQIGDYWDDFAARVRAGFTTHGDCEDFALTCLIIGIEDHGWDRSKCRIARVKATRGLGLFDHAVAIYGGQVLDNRQRGPVPIEWLDYKWYDYSGIPITKWRLYEGTFSLGYRG